MNDDITITDRDDGTLMISVSGGLRLRMLEMAEALGVSADALILEFLEKESGLGG